MLSSEDNPLLAKTEYFVISDNDVVMDRNVHNFGRVLNQLGQSDVRFRRFNVARRVVMDQDDG
jgi:hypothetical protein